ncbi:uncharacterized protein LOC126907037 [Daktulosphaira vitifoliae]|uniref:uncharacterized protein LOC126907037 n=1 Tax=Daktulosphaira vitifoliae TaxID=58002 RepID=UPI0021AA8034|nr:uncharacterized protein LOC126907037 [Daktulosphaira vitifoliae]
MDEDHFCLDEDFVIDEYENLDDKKDLNYDEINEKQCCSCNCLKMFEDDFRIRLKTEMSKLTMSEKRIYLFALISMNEQKKLNYYDKGKSSKFFQYRVKEFGIFRDVCKNAFVILHGTTMALVRNLCQKIKAKYLFPNDERGRHDNHLTISNEKKEKIKVHFFSILESPSIFKCAKKIGHPNISQLWLDFKNNHGHVARSTYTKYIASLLTPEVRMKYMCANEARLILQELEKYNSK